MSHVADDAAGLMCLRYCPRLVIVEGGGFKMKRSLGQRLKCSTSNNWWMIKIRLWTLRITQIFEHIAIRFNSSSFKRAHIEPLFYTVCWAATCLIMVRWRKRYPVSSLKDGGILCTQPHVLNEIGELIEDSHWEASLHGDFSLNVSMLRGTQLDAGTGDRDDRDRHRHHHTIICSSLEDPSRHSY